MSAPRVDVGCWPFSDIARYLTCFRYAFKYGGPFQRWNTAVLSGAAASVKPPIF
jgi:hypothetical protein